MGAEREGIGREDRLKNRKERNWMLKGKALAG